MMQQPAAERAVGEVCRAFSTPEEGGFAALADIAASTQATVVLERFLELHADRLATEAPGLADYLQMACRAGMRFDWAWDVSRAQVQRATIGEETLHAATYYGLHLASCGLGPAQWSAPLIEQRALVGHWELPRGKRVNVRCDDAHTEVTVESSGPDRVVVLPHDGGDLEGDGAQPLPTAGDRRIVLTPPEVLPRLALCDLDEFTARGISLAMGRSCTDALELLQRAQPAFGAWVTKVMRKILPLRAEQTRTRSGSRSDFPGLVHMSLPLDPVTVAEMLVHESSHQYYHMACHIGRVDTGEDQRLYYSPAKGTERPLSRILLAFHAFANVALMYDRFVASGVDDTGQSERQRARMAGILEDLFRPLDGNGAITTVGRALVEPLADRLQTVGIL